MSEWQRQAQAIASTLKGILSKEMHAQVCLTSAVYSNINCAATINQPYVMSSKLAIPPSVEIDREARSTVDVKAQPSAVRHSRWPRVCLGNC